MVDYCLSQNSLFGASDISENLLSSDQESSCASTDLNELLYLDFDEDQFTEEMINNVGFNQNSNNSTCSTNSNQTIYNSPAYSSLANGFSPANPCNQQLIDQSNQAQLNQCGQLNRQQQQQQQQQQQPLLNNTSNMVVNSLQDSQFAMMSNGGFASGAQAGNSANPLLSYSNQTNNNELVRIQNECVSMSPTCSNTSSVSSHTLPSFMDTYSSAKLNAAAIADINASIIEETGCPPNQMPAQVARSAVNGAANLNGLNHNLDENFDSDDLLYELGPNEFCDDQSYSNSSFASVNLPTPPTTTAELVTMTNCQTNPIFNLATSNCSSSMLVNTPVPTPLNGLSNCSSPISSIQDISNKPMKFKQEPLIEYDCNNNLTVLNQANSVQPMNNSLVKPSQPSTSIYSPSASLFNKPVESAANSMLYNDFNSFDLDIYPKNELTTGEAMSCMNGQSIMNLPDQSRLNYQPAAHPFNNTGANRIVQPTQLQSHLNASVLNKCTTLNSANKKLNPSLLQVNQMNQQNKNLYQNQAANRLKFVKNQMMLPDSSNKFKQINQFAQQLNSAKYGSTIGKTSMVCLVCGDQANCCHYKVVTCEGCKGFFKRTVQKGAKYTCLGNKDCVVDKRRRNRCQYCRYQKCLAVGMQKQIVRTDNLKGRRGRLPSKAKFPINVASNSPSIEFIRPLLEKLIKNYPTLKKPKQTLYRNENDYLDSLSNNSMEFVGVNPSFNNDYLRNEQFSKFGHDKQQIINQFKQIALEFTNDFARQIPSFSELDENDRKILITNSSVEVFTLFFAYRHSPGLEIYEFDDNFRLSRSECEKVFGQWFRSVEELMGRLQNMQIDLLSFTYLLAIVILYGYSDLNNCEKVDKIQNKLVNSLKDFTDKDIEAQKKSSYFPRLLNLLPDLKNLKNFVDDYPAAPLQFY